jgi:hypothetical protein
MEGRMKRTKISAMLGAMLLIGAVATSSVPAAAHSAKIFGAKLTTTTQPSNSVPGRTCNNPVKSCTWVMVDAFKRPGTRLHWSGAPRNGTIKRLKLIAGGPGQFRIQLAKVKFGQGQARIVRSGRLIKYKGDLNAPYTIESFKLNMPVKRGQFIAIKARKTSAVRCTSGGPEILQFQPTLPVGGPLKTASSTSGCNLLIQLVMK